VTLDQVVILLVVVLMLALNVVVPMLRRAARGAKGVEEEGAVEKVEVVSPAVFVRRQVVPVEQAGPRPPQARHHRPLPALTTAPRRGAQRVARREARRGVVLMTILGPCRANDSSV